MSGQLKVTFKNKSTFITNLDASFFAYALKSDKGNKVPSPIEKALDIAFGQNNQPHTVLLTQNGKTKFNKVFEKNAPDNVDMVILESAKKKKARIEQTKLFKREYKKSLQQPILIAA